MRAQTNIENKSLWDIQYNQNEIFEVNMKN